MAEKKCGVEGRLEAIIVLLAGLLRQGRDSDRAKQGLKAAEEKAAAALLLDGLSQERAGKLLGVQKKRVNQAAKRLGI